MYFPDDIFSKIISFIPKHFEKSYINEFHKLCINRNCKKSINKIKELTNIYSLSDFNYLQNSYGHTPLHSAYQYSNYQIINLFEKRYPLMKNVKSFNGELPIEQKDIDNRTRNEHDLI